jgi:hypothetical protein
MTEWIEESGFEFGMPEGRYFRFEELDAYDEVKADALKEVDFVWVEDSEDGHDVVWMLEVKNVRGPEAKDFSVDDWTERLVQALTDGFIMVSSIWSGSWWGQELNNELQDKGVNFPSKIGETRVAVAFAKEGKSLDTLLASSLVDTLRDRLEGRVQVFQPREIDVTPVVFSSLGDNSTSDSLPIEVRD